MFQIAFTAIAVWCAIAVVCVLCAEPLRDTTARVMVVLGIAIVAALLAIAWRP